MIYLDNHSTTPIDPRVVEAMKPFYSDIFGNPSSVHVMGEQAKDAINIAKEQIASVINAKSDDIYFTSSATEANNIIIKGMALQHVRNTGPDIYARFLTTNTEHQSILKSCEKIERTSALKTRYLNIDQKGNIDLDELDNILSEIDILLVSVIHANNEIGTVHDIQKIGEICKKHDVLLHTDAVQSIGHVNIDVEAMNIFALTLSAHKIYGPKGIGALYMRDAKLIEPLMDGGEQSVITSGTQNTPAIVGFGKACKILGTEKENERIEILRDKLLKNLRERISGISINGTMKNRLVNNLNICIDEIPAEILVKGLDNVIISGGSACGTGDLEPSHVIKALGVKNPKNAIRFGLGRFTTEADIEYACDQIREIVNTIRG